MNKDKFLELFKKYIRKQNLKGDKKKPIKAIKPNKSLIPYEDLEIYFTTPKVLNPHSNHKRVPRKFKKKWKYILQGDRYNHLDLNQKLWMILGITNPDYKRFLIKQTVK